MSSTIKSLSLRLLSLALLSAWPDASRGTVFNVNSASDTHAVNLTSGLDARGKISIRSALEAANSQGGAHTLNIPGLGTYNLAGEWPIIGTNLTLTLHGTSGNPADAVIHQTLAGTRMLETELPADNVNQVCLVIENLTFDNGQGGNYGGGALLVGGIGSSTTVRNCVFRNNRTFAGANVNAGGAIENSPNGEVTLLGCTFQGNISAVSGGAVDFLNQAGGTGSLVVSNCVFLDNAAAADGGAIKASSEAGLVSVLACSFVSNRTTTAGSSGGRGGAIAHFQGRLAANFNRFFDNSAGVHTNGDTLFRAQPAAGLCDATRNWWGTNGGPGSTDVCAVAPVTTAPWLQLRHTPATTVLPAGASTALTADLLGLSSGGALAPGSLAGLPPISSASTLFHDAVRGSLSGASCQFTCGVAKAVFTAGKLPGIATVDATLDRETVTASLALPQASMSLRVLGDGHYRIGIRGMPNATYQVDYAANAKSPWQVLGQATTDAAGTADYDDLSAVPSRLYRLSYP